MINKYLLLKHIFLGKFLYASTKCMETKTVLYNKKCIVLL